jgi:3-oxoacyl-[acyl-carrier protein] reductase
MADTPTTATAIVTGAGRGIGAAIAADLARRGYHVVVNYRRDADAAAAVVTGIRRSGGSAVALAGDVTAPNDVASLVATVLADRGRIDALVVNANTAAPRRDQRPDRRARRRAHRGHRGGPRRGA